METIKDIKIAVLPLDIVWCDVEKNISVVEKALESMEPDTDILLLPELFSTGFVQDDKVVGKLADDYTVLTLNAIQRWTERSKSAVCGSFMARGEDGGIYNRAFFITPDGEQTFYDKRHLFCLSPEAKIFTPGKKLPPHIFFRGWNLSMIVCYDLRFPVWCRNKAHYYDVLLVPANWPTSRGFAWQQLLIARAIENQAVVVGADRSGTDDYGDYNGLAFAVDPIGARLAPPEGHPADDSMFYVTYKKELILKCRRRLPVGADADNFIITHINDPVVDEC